MNGQRAYEAYRDKQIEICPLISPHPWSSLTAAEQACWYEAERIVCLDEAKMSKMIVRYIRGDERYPVYALLEEPDAKFDTAIELTAEELADYEETMRRYKAWQDRCRKAEYDPENP